MAGNNLTRRDFVAAVAASALMPSVVPVGLPSEPAIAPFHYRAPDAALDDLKSSPRANPLARSGDCSRMGTRRSLFSVAHSNPLLVHQI